MLSFSCNLYESNDLLMSVEYATSIGSGTTPHVQYGPVHSLTPGSYPVPSQRDDLRTRRGDGAIILNPEDFSVSVGLSSQSVTVGATAVALPTNPLEFRRALAIHNLSASTIYIGDATVTTSDGFPILASEKIALDVQNNPNVVVYAIAGTAGNDIRILELS